MTRPHAALVHDWLNGMRGGERVLEAIAKLFPEAPIYTLLHVRGSVSPELEARSIHTSFLQGLPGFRRHYRRFLPLFPQAIEGFDLRRFDLVISSSHCVAKGAIPAPGALHVCYCHTPMRYAWDQEHVYFPRRRGLQARLRGAALTALRSWDVSSSTRVDRFVANSRFVARRIRRYYGRDAEVIPPPVDVDYFAAGGASPTEGDRPYALAVSALAPYKRLDLAIAACERRELELRIVGDGPERAPLRRLAGPHTRLLGTVERGELRRLYRGARLFIQPGVEDFGIASVEALAAGTPVVAVAAGGVLDIVEDGEHGILYEGEEDVEALIAAIDKSVGIRFNDLKLADRARSFSADLFRRRFNGSIARWTAGQAGAHDPSPPPEHRRGLPGE